MIDRLLDNTPVPREVEGLAAGCELPVDTVMALNLNCPPEAGGEAEGGTGASASVLDKGCTTLLVPDPEAGCLLLAHTEDGPPGVEDKMCLVEVDIPASGGLPGDT